MASHLHHNAHAPSYDWLSTRKTLTDDEKLIENKRHEKKKGFLGGFEGTRSKDRHCRKWERD
jgi:hypothetical protein